MPNTIIQSSSDNIQANRVKYKSYFAENQNANDLTMDTFLNLLMAEMTNQNPLEPMSNTEFVTQMAQFTSLQAMQTMNYNTNASYATSLVGKTVRISQAGADSVDVQRGLVTAVQMNGKSFTVTVNGKNYELSSVKEVISAEDNANESDLIYASGFIGRTVTIEFVDETGDRIYVEGKVDSVEKQNGEAMVVIEDIAFPVSSIVRVLPNEVVEENSPSEEVEG